MHSERLAWVREVTGPLVAAAIMAAVGALNPGVLDRLGFVGAIFDWKWTPTLTFTVLAVLTLLVKRKGEPEGTFVDDAGAGFTIESDGVLWVFRGWRDFGAERVAVLEPECAEHHIPFQYKTIGKGEKLVPLNKATTFTWNRAWYCAGGNGHDVRPSVSANMQSARLRADAIFRGHLNAMERSGSRTLADRQ